MSSEVDHGSEQGTPEKETDDECEECVSTEVDQESEQESEVILLNCGFFYRLLALL